MKITEQIAKSLRHVHFGGNWTESNFKDQLSGVTWQMATTTVHTFNTIAVLTYHTYYYIDRVLKVLQGGTLDASDASSFEHPPMKSEEDWQRFLDKVWADAETFATLIEQLPGSKLEEIFVNDKYGTYYRNLTGIIEHHHYHLGQIILIKKLLSPPI